MTERDKIISMARAYGLRWTERDVPETHDALEAFYALAIDHKCELLAAEVKVLREALESAKGSLWDYRCDRRAEDIEKILDAAPSTLAAEILRKVKVEVAERCAALQEKRAGHRHGYDKYRDAAAIRAIGAELGKDAG